MARRRGIRLAIALLLAAMCVALPGLLAYAEPSGAIDESAAEQYKGDFSGTGTADTSLDTTNPDTVIDADENIAIEGLISGGSHLNGLVVVFDGEVIGNDVNAGDGYKWVTLYDDGASIAVYMSDADAAKITHRGSYSSQGDTLKVVGVFHLDCPSHQGDVDVHAQSVEVISNGFPVAHGLDMYKVYIAAGLLVLAGALGLLYWRLRERLR
ncbi:MAG: hypothetical protein IKE61_04140 [Coriobacteriales bacterium]|nr:hypothetical protein [Coriobacteriales bacterium]